MIHSKAAKIAKIFKKKAIKFLCVLRIFAVSLFSLGMNRHSDVMAPCGNDNRAADIMKSLLGLNDHK
jgi:hypothetical protein